MISALACTAKSHSPLVVLLVDRAVHVPFGHEVLDSGLDLLEGDARGTHRLVARVHGHAGLRVRV